jgi:hypothetical protein
MHYTGNVWLDQQVYDHAMLTLLPSSRPLVENPYDYQGRSYLHVPQDTDVDLRTDEPPDKCFAPKNLIHQWLALWCICLSHSVLVYMYISTSVS